MTNKITFDVIENFSTLIDENDFFQQYTNYDLLDHSDTSFLNLNFSPDIKAFKLIEKLHTAYHFENEQYFSNIYWPMNTGIQLDTLDYLFQHHYKIGMENLYLLNTDIHPINVEENKEILIKKVNESNFNAFKKLNYNEDMVFGNKLANNRSHLYDYQFSLKKTNLFVVYYKENIVASVQLIYSDKFIEIDNLLVDKNFRRLGIATALLSYVYREAVNKKKDLILVADAESSVCSMYENFNFESVGYRINARKYYSNKTSKI